MNRKIKIVSADLPVCTFAIEEVCKDLFPQSTITIEEVGLKDVLMIEFEDEDIDAHNITDLVEQFMERIDCTLYRIASIS